jgi:hypothetical protein
VESPGAAPLAAFLSAREDPRGSCPLWEIERSPVRRGSLTLLSVLRPLRPALARTRALLFAPFQLRKWLRLGFCAFLAAPTLVQRPPGGDAGKSSEPDLPWLREAAMSWRQDDLPLFLLFAGLTFLLMVALGLLVTWLSSRGQFMCLDGIVRNRGAIRLPWYELRREANSLFVFRVCFGIVAFGVFSILTALLIGLVLSSQGVAAAAPVGWWGLASLALFSLLAWAAVLIVVAIILSDFVVPLMYLYRIPVLDALRLVREDLIWPRPGSVLLYLLARMVLSIILAVLALVAGWLTFSVAFLPYIGSVLLLPLYVFQTHYALAYLEQVGPEWVFFPHERAALGEAEPAS